MPMGENNRKDGQSTIIFSITERYTSIPILLSMSHEESRWAHKWMWKITSDVFIVFFLRIALKRPSNK